MIGNNSLEKIQTTEMFATDLPIFKAIPDDFDLNKFMNVENQERGNQIIFSHHLNFFLFLFGFFHRFSNLSFFRG